MIGTWKLICIRIYIKFENQFGSCYTILAFDKPSMTVCQVMVNFRAEVLGKMPDWMHVFFLEFNYSSKRQYSSDEIIVRKSEKYKVEHLCTKKRSRDFVEWWEVLHELKFVLVDVLQIEKGMIWSANLFGCFKSLECWWERVQTFSMDFGKCLNKFTDPYPVFLHFNVTQTRFRRVEWQGRSTFCFFIQTPFWGEQSA